VIYRCFWEFEQNSIYFVHEEGEMLGGHEARNRMRGHSKHDRRESFQINLPKKIKHWFFKWLGWNVGAAMKPMRTVFAIRKQGCFKGSETLPARNQHCLLNRRKQFFNYSLNKREHLFFSKHGCRKACKTLRQRHDEKFWFGEKNILDYHFSCHLAVWRTTL